MNILGIDYGKKYIGLALGDNTLKIAGPYKIVENTNSFISELKDIVHNKKIGIIVVGRPIGLESGRTKQTKATDIFINKLKKTCTIPVKSFDERLTSKLADKLALNGGENHSIAASIILQNYLDAL